MMSFDAVIRLMGDLGDDELRHWIAESWVRPESRAEGYVFHEVDVARVRLIRELRYDLAIDEGALPVVLHLLDQVYALRRRLRQLGEAIGTQPEEVRAALMGKLGPGKSVLDDL
ncbi:MAG TPA: chaperone modulator CbpM [Stellaceae bacterium]|nr:chaperone modulator CbpM [Stellaceae bacterium]